MDSVIVEHRRDLQLAPEGAYGVATSAAGKMVVIRKTGENGSGDSVLDQYSVLNTRPLLHEKVLCPQNGPIEGVCFAGETIVACHLNGSVSIMHPHKPDIQRVQISASPLWACCAADEERVYLVSHSAQLIIFHVHSKQILKTINIGMDQRLFSVASFGGKIAVGSTGSIFLFSSEESDPVEMQIERVERSLPTIVWALHFIKEGKVLVSGDSRGMVTFWNTEQAALLKSFISHQSDVLCISSDSKVVHAAGVDPRIASFTEEKGEFVMIERKTGPISDVRSAASFQNTIYFVGADCCMWSVVAKELNILIADQSRRVLVGGNLSVLLGTNYVDVHTVGEADDLEQVNEEEIALSRQPVFFSRIYSRHNKYITAAGLSEDGSVLCLSTCDGTSAYELKPKNKKKPINITKLRAPPATAVQVTKGFVWLCTNDFSLLKAPIGGGEAETIVEQESCGEVCSLSLSPNCSRVAVRTTRAEIYVVDVAAKKSKLINLPGRVPVSLSFPSEQTLYALLCNLKEFYSAREISAINCESGASSVSCISKYGVPRYLISISANPSNGQAAIISAEGTAYLIDKMGSVSAVPLEEGGASAIRVHRLSGWSSGWRRATSPTIGTTTPKKSPLCTLSIATLTQPPPTQQPFALKKFSSS